MASAVNFGRGLLLSSCRLGSNVRKYLPFSGVKELWSQRITFNIHSICRLSQQAGLGSSKPWQLASAVCLERFPVVCQEENGIEQRYIDMINNVELEKSALSQHELSVAADKRRMAKKQSGEQDEEEKDDGGDLLTALDLEDIATEELAGFQVAPRLTGADERDERHSLDRELSNKLVLIVKCKMGKDSVWLLPYGNRAEGETMKNAAVRVLGDHADDSGALRTHFMGNAPVGFYKQRYPKAVQEQTGKAGVKVFFFKAQYVSGIFEKKTDSPAVEDYLWVTQEELHQYLSEPYLQSIQKFMLPL
ncbi:large ribosomal subunit protein mL46-like [Lytechinus pictus]|uniref:large ribosomal subunit protein mL46-like n=1 Tax=Lytechinus pictus TaxID=7653 RepID=UPI0030BA0CFC